MSSKPQTLQSLLDGFHHAILDKDPSQTVAAIKVNPRISPQQQIAIYIDGYRLRLIEAIRSDYPALLLYLGENIFDDLALKYIESTPPNHFNLDRYPHGLAAIIRDYTNDDFATDLAELEAAIAKVFMLEESDSLSTDTLIGTTPEQLAEMVLKPRTASCLLHLRYQADTYMSDMREGHMPLKPAAEARALYLVRHDNEVKRHVLSIPEYLILSQLCEGITVDAALESVAKQHPDLIPEFVNVLQNSFGLWIANGFFQPA